MSEQLAPGTQDRVATILGWAIFITFFILFLNIITLPRTPLGERASLQMWHDSLGWILGVLCIIRLYWFAGGPAPVKPAKLPDSSYAFTRATLFSIIFVFAAEFVIGIFYAWGEGRQVGMFGSYFPQMVETSEGLRVSTGYPHSALAFFYLMLFSLWFMVIIWQDIWYDSGLRRLFPGRDV